MKKYLFFFLFFGMEGRGEAPPPVSPFFSIKKTPCNIRRGPGKDYPIVWVAKAGMPVILIAESEDWRRLKDHEGVLGWVHKNMLSKKESAFVIQPSTPLYKKPAVESAILAHLKADLLVWVRGCQQQWCQIKIQHETQGNFEGYVKESALWPHGGEVQHGPNPENPAAKKISLKSTSRANQKR